MHTKVRLSREDYDGTAFSELIEQVAAETGHDRAVVEHILTTYCRQLLEENDGEPVLLEDIGAVLVPDGYPDVVDDAKSGGSRRHGT